VAGQTKEIVNFHICNSQTSSLIICGFSSIFLPAQPPPPMKISGYGKILAQSATTADQFWCAAAKTRKTSG